MQEASVHGRLSSSQLSSKNASAQTLNALQVQEVESKSKEANWKGVLDVLPPPPDGGFRAWSQVFAAHLVVFNAWGYLNSFGIFQPYYESTLGLPASTISWIGSFQVFVVFFTGTFSGRALDAGYFNYVLWAGGLLQLVGIFMTSISKTYWQVFLAQGLCQGLGDGLCFCPTVALVGTYFSKRRSAAIATTASGAATGGIIFPLIAQQLLPKVGFGWTLRVMGLVILVNLAMVCAILRSRLPPRSSGPIVEWQAFKELPYTFFTIGMWFTLWGTYFAYYYVRPFALDAIGTSQNTSFTILLIFNAIGIPGRVIPAILADRFFSGITMIIPSVFCGSLCLYLWTLVHSESGIYVWAIFFGYFGASIQGLFPATIASLTKDYSKLGTRTGMVFSFVSVACLTGPPLAGKLVQVDGGFYVGAQVWGGTSLLIGMLVLTAAKLSSQGWQLKANTQMGAVADRASEAASEGESHDGCGKP